jgi:lactate dehydrogenase-like 2-hydroxyacid dehydrogenase
VNRHPGRRFTLGALGRQRVGVAVAKSLPDCATDIVIIDNDETPRLVQPNRRRQSGEVDERLYGAVRQRLALKTADIPTLPAIFAANHRRRA